MNDYLFSVEPDFPCLFPVSNDFEYRHPGINKMPYAVSSSLNHSLPAILCLNGASTSAAIFEAQTRNIRASLRSHYRFIYLDAPYDSSPGPGVVPSRILVLFTAGSAMNHHFQLLEPPSQVSQALANTFQPHSHTKAPRPPISLESGASPKAPLSLHYSCYKHSGAMSDGQASSLVSC